MNNNKREAAVSACFKEGNYLNHRKETALAIEKYLEVLKLNPKFVPALNQLGIIYEKRKEFDKAINYFQRVVQQIPSNSLAQARLAIVIMKQGNIQEALTIYKKAITLKPKLPAWIHNSIGDLLVKEAAWKDEAIASYQKAVEIQPTNLNLCLKLADTQKNQGNIDEAILIYMRLIALRMTTPLDIYKRLGKLLTSQNRISEAILAYQKAISIDNNDWDFYFKQTKLLIKTGNLNQAISTLNQAIERYKIQLNLPREKHENIQPIELSTFTPLEKLIFNLAKTEVTKRFFLDSIELISFKKGSNLISKDSILLLTEVISHDSEISFEKKCVTLTLISSLVKSKNILRSWLKDFSRHSSLEQDLIVFALLAPYRKQASYDLTPYQRLQTISELRKTINQKMLSAWQALAQDSSESAVDKQKKDINNFLFVVAHIPFFGLQLKTSSHLKTIIDYAYFLTKANSESVVNILITNEFSFDDSVCSDSQYPTVNSVNSLYDISKIFYPDIFLERIQFVSLSPLSKSQKSDYPKQLLQNVISINPDIVLFFGGIFSSWSLPEILHTKYPTLYMQFNVKNIPRSNYDIYIANGNPKTFEGFINPERWRKHRRPVMPFPKQNQYSYTRVKSSPEFITIITVGGKLESRIQDNYYIDRMAEVLQTHAKVCWLLVGITDVDKFLQRSNSLENQYQQGKVKFIKFDSDLRALYELCDIYAYPKHGGGGNGTRLAAVEGLPIVCHTPNDAEAYFQGTPIKFYESNDEYFQYLEHLIEDEVFRKAERTKVKSFAPHPDHVASCIDDFLNLCKEAQDSFDTRYKLK